MEKYTNDLIKESSPYLLQHAHNPVNWVAWSDDIAEQAKRENKLVLISVGYSACHWCHVMEHESFEDEEVAALMNKFFICVKVDREERPDVDQVYMSAVQLMTQQGGWPLNCFTLPDGRPVYGGTYYPKEQWMHILKSLHHAFVNDFDKVEEYATNLHDGIKASEIITSPKKEVQFEASKLTELLQRWSKQFDHNHGGNSHAPKFPLPNNFEFLLDYALNTKDEKLGAYVELSLDKMALGGIYDQIGGGFSRYSVDMLWKVPHFEKMLYDNGQLVSLYSTGYKTMQKPLYRRLVFQTIEWLEREMTAKNGAFFSALDADSEGVEGKFYVWKDKELKSVLGKDYDWAKEFYEVNDRGLWEEGNNILLRSLSDEQFQKRMGWSSEEFEKNVNRVNELLLAARSERIRPGLDDKYLTSWNAMMLKGLCDAYSVFHEESFLFLALRNANWLLKYQCKPNGGLWRTHKYGISKIDGFLEDYAHTIAAFISLYEVTFDDAWLKKAKELIDYSMTHFSDEKSGMFFFTPENTQLIARKMEINDNVLPASNSVMARNLYYLSKYFHNPAYAKQSLQMLANVYDGMEMYGSGYSNWAQLLNNEVFGLYEFVVVGATTSSATEQHAQNSDRVIAEIQSRKLPKILLAKSDGKSTLPIFKDKIPGDETMIYVCKEGTCFLPTPNVDEAVDLIQRK